MKDWLHKMLSTDKSFGDITICYLILGIAFYWVTRLCWFLLYAACKQTLKFYRGVYERKDNLNSNTLAKLYNIEYNIEDIYERFSIAKIGSNIKERLTDKGKLKYKLITKLLIGALAIVAAFLFVFFLAGNPYDEYLLITKGASASGYITDVTVDVEPRDAGGNTYYYGYSFYFTLPGGRRIESGQELSGGSPQEIPDLNNPYPVEIVYLPNKPEINRMKGTLSESIGEFLWRKIGIGLLLFAVFLPIGVMIIRKAIRNYYNEKKTLSVNTQAARC